MRPRTDGDSAQTVSIQAVSHGTVRGQVQSHPARERRGLPRLLRLLTARCKPSPVHAGELAWPK
jgi:hypothetical protein